MISHYSRITARFAEPRQTLAGFDGLITALLG